MALASLFVSLYGPIPPATHARTQEHTFVKIALSVKYCDDITNTHTHIELKCV
jgi:hypothetical protein